MRSALLAVLTRLLFPLEDEDLGVQHEHFRQRLFELPAEVHALAHRIDPQLGNMLDPLFAMDHEGERPEGVTLAKRDRKSTRLNSSHLVISYAVFCLKKKIRKKTLLNRNTPRHTKRTAHCAATA